MVSGQAFSQLGAPLRSRFATMVSATQPSELRAVAAVLLEDRELKSCNSNASYAELIEADPSWMGHTVSRLMG